MKILKSLQELREWRSAQQEVALIPTMGNLHDGHTAGKTCTKTLRQCGGEYFCKPNAVWSQRISTLPQNLTPTARH